MIEAEHAVAVNAGRDKVWDYVQDIRRWANLFPGCRECRVIDDDNSSWTIKVGAGGMVRTVNVLVHIDEWAGPERVNFSFTLETEPVTGSGSYVACVNSDGGTDISMQVRVVGSGSMAPMWEAMCKPLLPQLAKTFAGKLKVEIESVCGVASLAADQPAGFSIAAIGAWFVRVYRAVFGIQGESTVQEDNKALVLKFIRAMGAGEGDTAATCLAADAFTLAKGFGRFAGVRQYDTIVGTIAAFKTLLPDGLKPDIKMVMAEGDRVAVEFEGNGTTSDGQPYCNEYCMIFTVHSGKIKQVNEYFCTIRADEVLWPLVEKMSDEIPAS